MKSICYVLFLLLFSCYSGQKSNYNSTIPLEQPKADVFKSDTCIPDTIRFDFVADSLKKDSLQIVNFERITRIINGGINGLSDRLELWERAKKILKDTIP